MHLLVTCYGLYALSFSTSELRNYLISNTQYIHKAFVRMPKIFFFFNKTEQVKSQMAPPHLPHWECFMNTVYPQIYNAQLPHLYTLMQEK